MFDLFSYEWKDDFFNEKVQIWFFYAKKKKEKKKRMMLLIKRLKYDVYYERLWICMKIFKSKIYDMETMNFLW